MKKYSGKTKERETLEKMFSDWNDTVIRSCLDQVMGEIYYNESSAVAYLGDFSFWAGEPSEELLKEVPVFDENEFTIAVPLSEDWAQMIEDVYKNQFCIEYRYALKKEPGVFDRELLKKFMAEIPDGYELKDIDVNIFEKCDEEIWSRDFVSNYSDYSQFEKTAAGIVAIKDGRIVAGASSYSAYNGGIEIEIVTKEEHRRKGLARVCAAALILKCLDKKLYPSWDARTKISLSLAKQLGYNFDCEYKVYEIFTGEGSPDIQKL